MANENPFDVDPKDIKKWSKYGGIAFVVLILLFSVTYIVDPGYRGVIITMGKVSPGFAPEGLGIKLPFFTKVVPVAVRQLTGKLTDECFSSDLQQVNIELRVLYRIPEASVVRIYKDYSGDPFDSLIAPRVSEALKEMTALHSAEMIVKKREDIKTRALTIAQKKIGEILTVEDVVLQDIGLSKELAHAIEAKMVQEQEVAKSKFVQQKTEIEATTAVIRAKGEAQAIEIRGRALKNSPALIQLQVVEKWDGKAPLVVSAGANSGGSNIILPLGKLKDVD